MSFKAKKMIFMLYLFILSIFNFLVLQVIPKREEFAAKFHKKYIIFFQKIYKIFFASQKWMFL